ncbi:MAG: ABC transporter ATP-binding protein, partial [Acholeplasmataceae bacterium]|nr:ABC transporter ATP-binding protein [Acholeplasmataceae bacterium]
MQKNPIRVKKGTFKRLLGLVFRINKWRIILVVLFMLIATTANVGGMSMIQNVLAEASNIYESGSNDFSKIIIYIGIMINFFLINMLFSYSYLRIMIDVGQNSLLEIRNGLFNHMIDLPLKYFDTNKHGDIMSRYTNDVDATRQMISQSLPNLISSLLLMLGFLVAMIVTSWQLAIFTVIFAVLLIFLTRMIAKRSKKYFIAQQKNVGALNGYVEEMIEGQKVIKVFRHEDEAIKDFAKINRKVADSARISMSRSGMLIPITINVGFLGFSVTAIIGGIMAINNLLTVPQLVAYLLFTRQFMGPVNQMGQQLNFVQMALAGSSRIFEVMDMEKEVDEGHITLVNVYYDDEGNFVETDEVTKMWAWKDGDTYTMVKGDVRLEDVDFGYNDHKLVLKNISVFAKPGQKIAFVGSTGAGKTTITNLINRFYEINSGVITFDGIDIKKIKKSSLRKSLGIVLQDTHLFQTTVRENIRYGYLNATDEQVVKAAKLANAHEFILKLPEGYDTIITGDGSNLSQGQRQLISIARAAISNPPVLILDEATSSIDTYTERLIQDGMDKLMEGRTVFVIAHRLSTIKNSKAIIILEDGSIIERGKHSDLIDLKGTYYQLYTGAFELRS